MTETDVPRFPESVVFNIISIPRRKSKKEVPKLPGTCELLENRL